MPDGLDLRTAALAEPLAVALHAITRSEIAPGQPALVMGAGPIGALIAAALVDRGHRVVVVEPAPIRQALADKIGAAAVRHPDDLRVFNMAEVDTLADEAFPGGVRLVRPAQRHRGRLQPTRPRRAAGDGRDGHGATVVRPQPHDRAGAQRLRGLRLRPAAGSTDALELLASGRLPVDVLIDDEEYGLDGIAEATHRLATGEIAGKLMIVPSGGAR